MSNTFSVVHISETGVKYIESFSTIERAITVFSFLIQEQYPLLTEVGVKDAIKNKIFGTVFESFHIIELACPVKATASNIVYTLVHVVDSYIEYIEMFSTKARSNKILSYMVQENYPMIEESDIKDILEEQCHGDESEYLCVKEHKIS